MVIIKFHRLYILFDATFGLVGELQGVRQSGRPATLWRINVIL